MSVYPKCLLLARLALAVKSMNSKLNKKKKKYDARLFRKVSIVVWRV